jgi:hypothetical protein
MRNDFKVNGFLGDDFRKLFFFMRNDFKVNVKVMYTHRRAKVFGFLEGEETLLLVAISLCTLAIGLTNLARLVSVF